MHISSCDRALSPPPLILRQAQDERGSAWQTTQIKRHSFKHAPVVASEAWQFSDETVQVGSALTPFPFVVSVSNHEPALSPRLPFILRQAQDERGSAWQTTQNKQPWFKHATAPPSLRAKRGNPVIKPARSAAP